MTNFKGFTSSESFTRLPSSFFSKLLKEMDDLGELKIVLYLFWRIEQMEGAQRVLSRGDIASDEAFMSGWSAEGLDEALEKATRRGILLRAENDAGGLFALNTPRGRATVEALNKGRLTAAAHPNNQPPRDVPNVFRLYEENFGALTPLIADALKDSENEYSAEWIEDAMSEALKRNIRNWKYVEAILKGWKERGRNERRDQKDAGKNANRYGSSAFAEYLEGDPDAQD
ncbi:MAG: DnaD domain protein [Anaerolineae bacterium]|nr:DnaD domain protein [Anaerolineae bacterium]